MPSSPESDRPFDESAEEIRCKERELTEAEVKLARRKRMVDRLRILQTFFTLVALATGHPAYRWATRCAQRVIYRVGAGRCAVASEHAAPRWCVAPTRGDRSSQARFVLRRSPWRGRQAADELASLLEEPLLDLGEGSGTSRP
ncbi:hypothetical protein VR41_05845 [Streptomyces sp. NRRL B-1568]|nr:hypothetical protein VR41_05845 [Streptomyces sp. NRRL B-1568]